MARAYTNFAKSTLAAGIAPAAVSVTVAAGDGALFPAAGAGTTFDCVIYNTSAQREIVSCTSRTGDVLTIVRAQQGTTALTWNAADRIGHRLTAAALNSILFADNMQQNTYTWCGTAGGTANALTLTPTPAVSAMVAGHRFTFKSGAAANTGAATMAVSGLGAFALQNKGAALVAGDIQPNSWYEVLYDGTNGQLTQFGAGSINVGGGKFTVDAATGNTVVGGTLGATGGLNLTSVAGTSYVEVTGASVACTGAITASFGWKLTKVGRLVTLHLPAANATAGSATNSFSFGTALPVAYRPAVDQSYSVPVDNAGKQLYSGAIFIASATGLISVYRLQDYVSNFTNGANVGLSYETSVSWYT